MAAWERDTPWRQGQVLTEDAARALELLADMPDGSIAIVVSHDCDLAQDPSAEPNVEIIVGRHITAADGNLTYAKNVRRLHLTFTGGKQHIAADLNASQKISVPKFRFAEYEPLEDLQLTPLELNILQRWLASRYRRPAFPDEFDIRLGRKGLRDRIGKILKSSGSFIAAVYFDLDQGEDISHVGSDDPYSLAIYLLFSTESDPNIAEQTANTAAVAIRKAFTDQCLSKKDGAWNDIELTVCEAISDRAMTVQQAEILKRWSADHISLKADAPHVMLRDE